ncbi:hypothetical protein VTJ04DRAFT_551 [Mycothermus thermophilus]|uniref:uncharacterized protein n=1 Tax=Humicola insolens TaxID=85995 RepID=UPI00374337F9
MGAWRHDRLFLFASSSICLWEASRRRLFGTYIFFTQQPLAFSRVGSIAWRSVRTVRNERKTHQHFFREALGFSSALNGALGRVFGMGVLGWVGLCCVVSFVDDFHFFSARLFGAIWRWTPSGRDGMDNQQQQHSSSTATARVFCVRRSGERKVSALVLAVCYCVCCFHQLSTLTHI